MTTQPDTATVIDDPKAALIDAAEIRFEPVRVSTAYQFGLAVVAVAMLLLPAIYVALIGVLAAGTWYWATHAGSVILPQPVPGKVMLYAGPIAAGFAAVLFMVKPIFARHPKPPEPDRLDRDEEPVLYAFVERLCRAIGAPPPREIHVDLTVNASASFRRGARSMVGRDLVLTLGLPLVAGADVRQFAGVLAHEFGHFTQAMAMRFSYVIGSVNHWFARVVYERDEWDLGLEQAARGERNIFLRFVVALATFFISLSRAILRMLMHVGHGISCYLLRQMEYNADAHQARVAGSDGVRDMILRLGLLQAAANAAEGHVRHLWSEGRAVNDLPSLIRLHAERMTREIEGTRRLEQQILEQKTGRFDTHPSAAERIRRAARGNAAPAIEVTEPATVLFRYFDRLAQDVTARAYRKGLGETAEALAVASSEEAAADAARAWAGTDTAGRLVFGTPLLQFGVAPSVASPVPPESVEAGISALAQARARVLEVWPALPSILSRYDEMLNRLRGADAALTLDDAGVSFAAADFGLSPNDLNRLISVKHEAEDDRLRLRGELASVIAAVVGRVDNAVALATHPEFRRRLGAHAPAPELVIGAIRALRSIVDSWARMAGLNSKCTHIALLVRAAESHEHQRQFQLSAGRLLKETYDLLGQLFERLNETAYPFDHAHGPVSIARYAVPEPPPRDMAILDHSMEALQRLDTAYWRCWGELATLVEHVEQVAGLPALEVPDVGAGSAESNQPHE